MRGPRLELLICLILLIPLYGCASSYHARAASAHHAYFSGDYGRALELIDKVNPARRDRLLYLLDKGMILHAAGEYEESNKVLTEAEELADALYAKSVSREVAATLWSEEARDYPGERHERAMIPVVRMLNYIMLDDWDGALVEVRRLDNTVEKVYGQEHEYNNAFSLYLSAMTWEALGKINDALIDYKKLGKSGAQVPYYGNDLAAMSRRLAMPVSLPPKGSESWRKSSGYRQEDGELVVIAATGRSPRFVSDWVSTGLFTVSMPRMIAYEPRVSVAKVVADGKQIGATHPFYNVGDDILIALKERGKRSLIRKMVKLSVQTGLYTAGTILMESDDSREQLAGLALSILAMSMAATDKADERSWRTLPAQYQIGRFYLKPGEHEIEVVPDGGASPVTKNVNISSDKPAVILTRFGDVSSIAARRSASGSTVGSGMSAKERELLKRVRANPGNGALKLELAEARIEAGKYDIESLVTQGIETGGSRRQGTFLLVTALTVREEYGDALRWAASGVKDGMGGQYAYYAKALGYLAGEGNSPSGGPGLTDAKTLPNAFNHYIAGLVEEKSGDYERATTLMAKAHELGLIGEAVQEHIIASYKRTDEDFKDSKRGADVVSEFAESLAGYL